MNHQNKIKSFDGIVRREKISPEIHFPEIGSVKKSVFYSVLKMGSVGGVTFALFLSISLMGSTMAYFNDTEKSTGNKMQAGTISFSLSPLTNGDQQLQRSISQVEDVETLETEEVVKSVGSKNFAVNIVPNESSLPLTYSVKGELDGGNSSGCDSMTVKVFFGDYHYNGLVKDFVSPKFSEMGEWSFIIELPEHNDDLEPNAPCNGNMVFNAELGNVSDELSKTYTDKKDFKFEVYNWDAVEPAPSQSQLAETLEVVAPKEATEEAVTPNLTEEIPETLPQDLIPTLEVIETTEPEPEPTPEEVEEPNEPSVEPLFETLPEAPIEAPIQEESPVVE